MSARPRREERLGQLDDARRSRRSSVHRRVVRVEERLGRFEGCGARSRAASAGHLRLRRVASGEEDGAVEPHGQAAPMIVIEARRGPDRRPRGAVLRLPAASSASASARARGGSSSVVWRQLDHAAQQRGGAACCRPCREPVRRPVQLAATASSGATAAAAQVRACPSSSPTRSFTAARAAWARRRSRSLAHVVDRRTDERMPERHRGGERSPSRSTRPPRPRRPCRCRRRSPPPQLDALGRLVGPASNSSICVSGANVRTWPRSALRAAASTATALAPTPGRGSCAECSSPARRSPADSGRLRQDPFDDRRGQCPRCRRTPASRRASSSGSPLSHIVGSRRTRRAPPGRAPQAGADGVGMSRRAQNTAHGPIPRRASCRSSMTHSSAWSARRERQQRRHRQAHQEPIRRSPRCQTDATPSASR